MKVVQKPGSLRHNLVANKYLNDNIPFYYCSVNVVRGSHLILSETVRCCSVLSMVDSVACNNMLAGRGRNQRGLGGRRHPDL